MPATLDNATRRALRQAAHHLKPVVRSGAAGLSDAVLAEIDRALSDHELVKIRLAAADKAALNVDVDTACRALDADCVQRIGRTATLYRTRPDA